VKNSETPHSFPHFRPPARKRDLVNPNSPTLQSTIENPTWKYFLDWKIF